MDILRLLTATVEKNASDLHFKVGRPPLYRVAGELLPEEGHADLTAEEIYAGVKTLVGEGAMDQFRLDHELDISYDYEGVARFRINLFFQRGKPGVVFRRIPLDVPSIESLGLPLILKELSLRAQGWILVAGPTGSGKSTSMAAMVEYINVNRACHIVTIEDPIEFIYTDKKSTINQRQLGTDTASFDEALRRVLRQDPDVILMGEMRDAKSMETAMLAAETGHLVFSTIHTQDTKQTLDRVMGVFPGDQSSQIRQIFAQTLAGVVAQKLLTRKDGKGLVAAVEVLINSPHMSQLLADGKVGEITEALQKGGDYYQMQSFNQDLARLVSEDLVTPEEALSASPNPGDLKLLLRGVGSGTNRMHDADKANGKGAPSTPPAGGISASAMVPPAGDSAAAAAAPTGAASGHKLHNRMVKLQEFGF